MFRLITADFAQLQDMQPGQWQVILCIRDYLFLFLVDFKGNYEREIDINYIISNIFHRKQ